MGTAANDISTPVPACSNTLESCQLDGLNPLTLYHFNIIAKNAAGSRTVTTAGRALSVGTFDVTSSVPSDGTITFNWNASVGATSYNIIYGTVPGSYPNTITGISSPYVLSGLSNGVTYYARIVAVNNDNGYGLSTSEGSAAPFGPLGPPQNLVATATPGVVTLDWDDLGGALSYQIYDTTGTILIGTSATSNFTHNHGSNGTTYTYKVRALNGFNGAFSSVVSAQSIANFAMTSAVAGPLPGQATVTWPAPVTGAATYNIRYGSNPLALNLQVTGVTSPYVFPSLVGGLTYYFNVVAVNAVGAGTTLAATNQLSATPVSAIAPPAGLTATASPSGVTLNWTAVPGASQYNIYRGTSSGSYAFVNSSVTNTFFDAGAIADGSSYFYVVRSFNGLESANSLEVSRRPIANFSLTSATVASFSSADLVWNAAPGAAANPNGYDILYGTAPGSYTSSSLNRTTPTTLTGLSAATTYYVVIRAKNAVGGATEVLSNERTFTTSAEFPTVAITTYPLINNANRTAYTVSGTCSEEGRNVSLNIGGVTGSVACTSLAWSLTLDVTAAADSPTRSIIATHTNSGGNSITDTRNVIKDTVNPTVSITTFPSINITNEAAYTISGACSENTRAVNVSVGGINAAPICTALSWTATINVSALSDSGSISITADHNDAAGNTATQATRSVIKDTVGSNVAISGAPTINLANRTSYPVNGTCSETGETVVVRVGAVVANVTCTLLTWSASMNVTAVADAGTVVVTADHSDAAGNAATQATTLVLKDTVIPTVTIAVAPTIINANRTAYTVSGTCSENTRTVSVSVGGVTGTPTCTGTSWTTTLDVTAVPDSGSVAVSATHTDVALNSNTASLNVVKNTALPTVTILSSTAINNTNRTVYPVNGGCSENGRIVTVNVGGVSATPTCSGSLWSTTVNVTAVADAGSVLITANHSDSVGNNANQASVNVLKDTVIPTVTISLAPSINNTNRTAYTVSGTCSENTRTVTVSVSGVAGTPICSGSAWTLTVDATAVADGASRTITADHTDLAGNSATQASVSVIKDVVIPTVTISTAPAINNVNRTAYTISGACSENTRTVSVNVAGVTAAPVCTAFAWSATLNVNSLADSGSVSITANHSDAAGNAATQASTSVVKDTALPTVSITVTPVINFSNRNAYTFSGTCSDTGQSVSVAVGSTTSSVTCTLLTWSATLNVSANADSGTLVITADHSDAAGNAAVQAGTSVVKDTLIPTVTLVSTPAITSTNQSAYTISGACSENTRTVSVNVGGVSGSPSCSGSGWTATLDVSAVADSGSVSITANHSDSAGNNATQAATTVVKQTVVPTVTITAPTVINLANRTAYTVSGTCSINARPVNVSVGGVTSAPVCTTSAWSATLNVTAVLDNGSVGITADHSDSVGNNAIQATASIVKDTVIPTVTISSSPLINNANRTAYTVSGACSENGRTVSLNVGSVSASPTCSSFAWTSTIDVTSVVDSGSVSVTANHTDAVLNAATQASASVVKDTSNPTVAITSSPVINFANRTAYTLSGTCSENTRTVSVSVGGVSGSPTCTGFAWTTTLNVTAVVDNASVSITADHSDVNGNNATQATASVLKDTGVPTVAITSSTVINNTNRTAYTVTGTCSENARVVTVNIGAVSGTPTCTTGAWTSTLDVTSVADNASLNITANHSDAAGNAATQATQAVLKDTVNPTVAISSSPNINSGNAAAYPISGTCSENARTVSVNVGGVTASPTCTGSAWSASMNVTGVADSGSVAVTANHSDAAGNNATQASATVSKVTSLPTVSITSNTAINDTNKAVYPVSGACSVNGQPVSVNVGGVTSTPTCTTLAWSTTVNVTGVGDGSSISITANHNDGGGNNAIQASATVLKDTVIPTVAFTSTPVINNANNAVYTFTGTCSENTRTVTVAVGAASGSGTCTTGSWTATLNVTAVPDAGAVTITANHTDLAGNNATQASTTVLKDTSNPTVSISAPVAINNTNRTAYPLSGSCSENTRTVSVSVGGVTASPVCTTLAWSTTLDVTAVADGGSISITANHTDLAGNNATQATATVAKDTAVPTVAILSSPIINLANRAAYTVSGTCSENTRTVSVNVGGVTGSPSCGGGTWSSTLNVTGVADGASISITANHSDAAGNNATQASASVLKDVVIPTVTLTAPIAVNNTNRMAYPIGGTCSENTRTVTVSVGGISGTPTCTTGTWSTTLDVTSVGDGVSVAVSANHSDAAGNNATQASATITKDTTAPTVAITAPLAINDTNKAGYTVSGTCSENSRTVTVSVGGIPANPTCTTLAWTTTVDASALSDAPSVAITANHSDLAGNNATQATANVLKDTIIPTVTLNAPSAINNANRLAYTIGGACSENTRLVSVNVGGVTATPTCTTLAWTATLNVNAVSDGPSVSITVNHTDTALNAATQASASVAKDSSNPTVAITPPGFINNTNRLAYTVSGSCSENTRVVTVSIGGIPATPTCSSAAWTTTVDASGLADGAVTITANHSDAAGNTATQASTSVTKDTTNPTVAITSNTAINNANRTSYPVSGTCSENTRTVSINVGGVTGSATCTTLAWSTTVNVNAVVDGPSIAITADHSDAAGNNATQATASVLKDTVIPTVSITSSPTINNTNRTAYTVSGNCSENTRNVSVAVGTASGTPVCTAGAWTLTLDVTSVADSATVPVTANHSDLAGNAATQASVMVLKDTNTPLLSLTAPGPITNANRAAYPVAGTCSENGRAVSVLVGGVAASPNCSAGAWTTTVDATGVSDGPSIAITANHSDASGNAATQASANVVKDTVIPLVAISTAPAINISNRTAYTVTGTCSENTRTVSVNVGGVTSSPVCTTGAWSATLNVTAVADGLSVSVTANHSDAVGNNATQASTTVTKDTSFPTVAINAPVVINAANQAAYTVSGTCSETGRNVTVNVGSVNTSVMCTILTWTVTVNASGNPDSLSLLITADHSDAAGNNAVQAGTTVVKDTVLPTVAITSSPVINNANRTAYTVSGTCSENTLTVAVNIGGVTASPSCNAGTWTTGAVNVTAVADSLTVGITANHSDTAGNAATQASATVVKDTSNPNVAITAPAIINLANRAAYTVSGSCSENTRTVTVSIGGLPFTPTCSGGTWTTGSVNVTAALDSATLSITANHTDASGNAATQASASVLKDTVAPTVALSSAIGSPFSAATFTVRATFSETVTGMLIGDFVSTNGTRSGFVAVSGLLYDVVVTPTTDGVVSVDMPAAAATDAAGNPSTAATQLNRTYASPAVLTFAVTSTYDFGVIPVGGSADVTMVINKSGSANATAATITGLAAPFTIKGGTFPGTGGTCTTTITASCTIVLTYTPTSGVTSNSFATIQYNNGASTVTASRAITGTGDALIATKIVVTGSTGITTNQCIPYTIISQAVSGLQTNVTANITVNLVVNNGTGTFYSNATCTTSTTSTTLATGTSTRIVYFQSTTASQFLTLVFNPTTVLTSTTRNVSTSGGPTRVNVNPPTEFLANSCNPIVIDLVDAAGLRAGRATATTVNLSQNGNALFYSDSLCTGLITSTTLAATVETATVYVRNLIPQLVVHTFASTGLTTDTASINYRSTLTWWNTNWTKRMPITIDNFDQATAHTNIQVLVRLDTSRITYADFQAGGIDIRFTLDDHATSLTYDIESWTSGGESLIWVRIPNLAASAQQIIYMYYGNNMASDAQSPAGTWSGYSGVWNMDRTGANYFDATGSGKDGVPVGTVTNSAGPNGNAIFVNGSSSIDTNFDLSSIIGLTSTFSFWIRSTQAGSNTPWVAPGITGTEQAGGGNDIFFGYIRAGGEMAIAAGNGAAAFSSFVVNDNNWRYVTMSRNVTTGAVRFYVNGVLNGTGTSETGAKTTYFDSFGFVGDTGGPAQFFIGFMDGIRLNNTVLTDARIRAEYKYSVETHIFYGPSENL